MRKRAPYTSFNYQVIENIEYLLDDKPKWNRNALRIAVWKSISPEAACAAWRQRRKRKSIPDGFLSKAIDQGKDMPFDEGLDTLVPTGRVRIEGDMVIGIRQ
jgi:hypothetical protein